jgi:[ribosomal protein S5]-alanine N-acetyltransferase
VHPVFADPDVQKTLFGHIHTQEESRARVLQLMAHWEQYGFGQWVFRSFDGEFVGWCGFFHNPIDQGDVVEVGYVLRAAQWRRGYATEMVKSVIAIGFDKLGFAEIYAGIDPANVASRHVLEKNGFEYVRDFMYRGQWPTSLFRLTSEQHTR